MVTNRRLVMSSLLASSVLVLISVSNLFSLDSLRNNRVQFGLSWKFDTPQLRHDRGELWKGVYRVGIELEYGRKLRKRLEGIISVDYIANEDQRQEKNPDMPYVLPPAMYLWYRTSYRLKTLNLGLSYVKVRKKMNFRFGETVGVSKVNYSFMREIVRNSNDGDLLNGYDIAYVWQNKVALNYPIEKWRFNFIYFEFVLRIYVKQIKGIMYESFYSTRPWEQYNPPKSLMSGIFLKAGIGKTF
jgi:hypothetical protein